MNFIPISPNSKPGGCSEKFEVCGEVIGPADGKGQVAVALNRRSRKKAESVPKTDIAGIEVQKEKVEFWDLRVFVDGEGFREYYEETNDGSWTRYRSWGNIPNRR